MDNLQGIHNFHHAFILYTNIPWDQTSKLYSRRLNRYMLIKYGEELSIFLISRGIPEYIYAKYYMIQHWLC